MNKKTVVIELCDHNRVYEGRLLGLVDDGQFHALMTKKRLQNKILSGATVPLKEIQENYKAGFGGLRMVLAIRKINDNTIGGKHMFISERLDYIGNEDGKGIGILGEDNGYYMVEEK